MQKVYLLLRSNKQTGPYSLEELLQLNLKPFDLVWVEGRSAAWQYPSEIPALKPYVPETPQAEIPFQPIATSAMDERILQDSQLNFQSQPLNPGPSKTETPKRVFVSIPQTHTQAKEQRNFSQNPVPEHKAYMPQAEQPVYEKKEEVKPVTSSASYTSSNYQKPVSDDAVHTNYARSLYDVEGDYTDWVYRQKTKKKSTVYPKDLVLTVLLLAVIGGGYYILSKPSVANSILPTNNLSVPTKQPTEKQQQETASGEILSSEVRTTNTTTDTKQSKNIKTKNPVTVSKSQTNSSVPQVQSPMPIEKTNSNIPDDNGEAGEPEVKQQQPKEKAPAQKRKLGEVLKGIFSKKDKKQETQNDVPVLEDPKPANNRQATRRDDADVPGDSPASNEISTASLMEQIDLSSNAPENWMMGIKNLKISLRNRSNATIQTASVTVNYYDENNQLLEKKLIYFSNVGPKARATVAAPDHKFADHVDFKLTTVSAKEDRYARY